MDQKVSALTTIPAVDRTTDLLYIVDTSAGTPNKVTPNALLGVSGNPVGDTDTQTLTNKTITAPAISSPVLSGTITGTYTIGGTPTFPSSVVTLTGSQTLTNKVLTSPTINTATIVNPTLTVDTISEFTGANGVTIDGLNIKDGALNTANSVNAAALDGIDRSLLTVDINPYKFRAYRTAAANTGSGAFAITAFDTESFDTNNNFSAGVYTTPVNGFYSFQARIGITPAYTLLLVSLFKNGAEVIRGTDLRASATSGGVNVSGLLQLAAGDTIDVRTFGNAALALDVSVPSPYNYFSGYLVSRT